MEFTEIELFKEDMKFSAGHFTIFSETNREDMHGHNFTVYAKFKLMMRDDGLSADYVPLKLLVSEICKSLNEKFIIPKLSKHLRISKQEQHIVVCFNGEEMRFLERDILLLEIKNATLEEFARYIATQIICNQKLCQELRLASLQIKVSSGPGQWASHLIENIIFN
ncbi:MAG: 6-pyruvoyl trahydropterin synthase family protein [Nodosilinea sp.]